MLLLIIQLKPVYQKKQICTPRAGIPENVLLNRRNPPKYFYQRLLLCWNRVKNARNGRLWFIGGPQSGILGCPGHFYPASYIIKEKEGAMAFITKVVMSSRCRSTIISKILEGTRYGYNLLSQIGIGLTWRFSFYRFDYNGG